MKANAKSTEVIVITGEIGIFDIKELNDGAALYRQKIRDCINICRIYHGHEPAFLHHKISEFWKAYRLTMAKSHAYTAEYMRRLKSGNYAYKIPAAAPMDAPAMLKAA